jgi:alkaline phosphatase
VRLLTPLLGGLACLALVLDPASASADTPARPTNVILVIGDGMGPQQIGLLELWARHATSTPYADGVTHYRRFAQRADLSLSWTEPDGGLVVDSACSATQLATGVVAPSEVLGLDARGDRATTIVEAAHARGLATGLVSDTRATHATPAAFFAHVPHRSMETVVAEQLVASPVDVMLSGGAAYFAPKSLQGGAATRAWAGGAFEVKSKRSDERDLTAELRASGRDVVFDLAGLQGAGPRVTGLFAASRMADAFGDRAARANPAPENRQPTLAEMASAALDRLDDDPDGFFLMIEAGQIDWAGHANDAGWLLAEMARMDAMLGAVSAWMRDRRDTLLVITADHETGGFGLSYSYADAPPARELPGNGMMGRPFHPNYNFGAPAMLDQLWAQTATLTSASQDLPAGDPVARAAEFSRRIERITGLRFDPAAAARALETEPRAWPDPEGQLGGQVPRFDVADAFYPYAEDAPSALATQGLSPQQGVVWATGTHTHTPVPVVWLDTAGGAATPPRLVDHPTLGHALFDALGL